MNKHLYRIIFNQSRGQLMVVQEDACGQGKGNGAEGVAATLAAACKAFSLRLSVLLIGLGLGSSALAADIVADPGAAAGRQPGVIQSANGLPVVQIAAPSAAGVSHNQYQQFNVGPGGALLNNSAVNVNTQLAGYISGNPNLKNGSARIILNEVTQPNPSQLRGYLEVAGQRAQVVIANPWGITCSGCGFINTPQATLTTGTPQLNAQGALTGYQVAGGRVSIDGAGLNAANVDSFAIISRAVSINANLYAQKLDLVLGRNQVDAATLAAQPLAASPSDAPAFALDVAQLGGMYANAIKLVGTEKGVGVNQLGTMAAQAGDLQLTSAGDLILRGQTHSQQNLILQADGQLRHDGVTRAERAIQADIAGQTALHQALSAGGDLTLNTGSLQGDGALAAGAQADGKLTDHGRLAVTSAGALQASGQLLAGGDVSLKAGQADLSQATVSASHGALDIHAAGDVNAQQARLSAASAARLTIDGQLDNRSGQLAAAQVDLQLGALDNRQGKIVQSGQADSAWRISGPADNRQGVLASAGHDLKLQSGNLDNRGGEISHAGAGALRLSADALDNREQGRIASDGRLDAQATQLDNRQGRLVGVLSASVDARRQLNNGGGVLGSDGKLDLSAGALDNGSGLIQSGQELQLSASSLTNADKGQILALGKDVASKVDVSGELRNQGKVAGNADLTVNAATIDNSKGTLQAASHLELSKQSSLINDGGHLAGQSLTLKADSLSNKSGELYAQGQLTSQLKTLDNSQGSLIGGQGVDLTVSDQLHNDGVLGSDGQVKLTAGTLENAAGTIQSGKDLQLSASSLTNADKGQILALGKDAASTVDVTGELRNQGKVAGNADLTVNAATIDNSKGTLQAASHLELSKQSTLTNDGGHIAGQSLKLNADSLSNQAGEIYAQQQLSSTLKTLNNAQGSLVGGQGVDLTVSEQLHNDGVLGSDGQVKLSAGALENAAGTIQSGKDLQLTASSLTNADKGQILALGKDAASTVDVSGELRNQGKVAGNADLTVNAASIDNAKGTLQAANHLELSKQSTLTNDGGHIAGQSLKLNADSLSNQAGEIYAQQQLSSTLKTLDNAKGSIIGGQGVDLTVTDRLHNDGVVGSDGQVKLSAGTLENAAGTIQSGKDLQLTVSSLNNADKGQILALGKDATSKVDVSGELHNQGKVAGNADLTVNAASIDNSKGTLQAASHLELSKQIALTNDGGHIASQSLKLNADSLSNQAGEIYAQQQLSSTLKTLNNAQGSLIGGQGVDLTVADSLHNDGVVGSDGQMKLSVGTLENAAGTIQSGKDLQLSALSLTNTDKGQILALGKDVASTVDVTGELHNQGKVAGNADLTVNAATIDNAKGTLQAAASLNLTKQSSLINDGGHIAGQSLKLNADSLSNQAGEIYAQQQLSSTLKTLNNAQGSLIGGLGVDLTVADSLHNDGVVGSDGQMKLSVGTLENAAGTIQSGKDLQLSASSLTNADKGQILALGKDAASNVEVTGKLHNQGKLAGNADLTVNAASIDNSKGTLQAANHLELSKQSTLTNDGGHIAGQSLKLNADSLSNQVGEVYAQQQLSSTLKTLDNTKGSVIGGQGVDLTISDQLRNDGVVGSDGQVKLSAGKLDNAAGTIQSGKDLQLTASSLTNADKGQILALGKDAASKVDVSGELHNQGKLAGNADLTVNAASIDNSKGTLQAASHLDLSKQTSLTNDGGHIAGQSLKLNADSLSNQAGEIYAQQQLSSQLKTLDNAKGSVIGGQGVDLTVTDQLHNDGVLGSDGQVKLNAGKLENAAGTIQSGKDLQLTASSLNNADKGQILALGKDAASTVDVSGELHNQGKVVGNADLTVNAVTIDNAKGTLQAASHLELSKQTSLTNDGGHIVAQGLNLKTDTLSNQSGDIRQIGAGEAKLKIGQAFHNQQGQLLSNGGLTLDAGQLDNRQGTLGSQGAQTLTVRQNLNNQGGTLASGQSLNLTLQGGLDNQKGIVQGDSLQLNAASLDNRGGGIKALGAGDSRIQLDGKLDNSAAGALAANGNLTLSANQLDNSGSLLQSAATLDVQLKQDAQNSGGTLQAGQLQLSAASLGNQHGQIGQAGAGLATLAIGGQIDNSNQGKIISGGQLHVTAGDLNNNQGVLSSQGDLTLRGSALNNQQGTLGSNGALTLNAGSLDNSGGLLQAGQTLQLDSGSLRNAGGKVLALGAGDSRLTVTGQLANGGQIAGNGNWQLKAQGLDNGGGSVYGQRNLAIDTVSLANAGSLLAGQDLSLKLQGDFINNAGTQLQANRNLSISASGNLVNNGQLQSSGNLSLSGVNWTNNGSVNIGGTLSTQLSQSLVNAGSLGAGTLDIHAGSLTNTASITAGDIAIQAGSLDNSGSKALLASAGGMALNIGGTLNNHDGAWLYSQGDMRIGQSGAAVGQVVNHIATLQSDGNMFIEAGRVSNESNPVSVTQTSSSTVTSKTVYRVPSFVTGYEGCGHDGRNACATGSISYVGAFNFIDGVDVSTQHVYTECNGDHCHEMPDQVVKYRLVSDDVKNQVLTVRREYDGTGLGWWNRPPELMTFYYINRDGGGYVYLPGFDPAKNLAPMESYGPVQAISMGAMSSTWAPYQGYHGGRGITVSLHNTNPNIDVARVNEISRNTTITNTIDVASGSALSAHLLVGGDFVVNGGRLDNQYSSIMAGGRVAVSSGQISNIGQQLKSTTTVTSISVVPRYTDFAQAWNCMQREGAGCTTEIASPATTTSTVIGSLDATIASNQHLSLQAPSIVNGKDAARVNVSAVSGNAVNNQLAVNQAQGQAIKGAGQQAATAGQTLQGSVGEAQGAQLNGALSSVAGQALGGTAAQGEAGKSLQGAVAQAQGAQLNGALANVAGHALQGQLDQAQGAQLGGALSGADGQKLKSGGVDAAAGGALGNTYRPAPATQQVTLSAGGAKAANPVANGYAVPDNGLFHAKPAPQQPYLVETNPQFTQYSNFISSDYLLKQLNYDPSKVEKRLGDGFYEQQLVTRAVTDMTGKRFLSGYGSAMQQYQQLMSNGAQYAKQFQLTPGMALSADQMAKLTSDMVWLVKQNVGGQDVLVPMVYLANADQKSLRGQGAVLAGNSMSLLASGDLVNTGTLKSDAALLAQANNIRIEGGKVQAGGDLGLLAAQNLTITDDSQHSQAGSSIKAGGDLQLQAGNDLKLQAAAIDAGGNASLQAGHDLDILSRETRYNLGGSNWYSSFQYQQADHVGSQLNIGGSLALAAGNDLTLSGSAAKAGGSVLASAGGSLTLASTLDSKHGAGSWWGGGYDTLSQTHNASLLQGGGDVLLKAGGDLSLLGSAAQSTGGSLTALAGKQLTVQSEVNTHHDIGYNWGNSHNWQTDSLTVAGLAGKGDLQLRADGDALLNGASLASGGKLGLSAGNDIKLGAVATESRNDNTWGETIRNNYDLTQHGTAAHGEAGLILQAGRDISTQAASLTSNGQEALVAGRDVTLGSAEERHSDYSKTVHHSSGWFSSTTTTDIVAHDNTHEAGSTVSADTLILKGQRDINIHASQVAGSGDVTLDAGRNLNITSGTDTSRLFQYHKEETSGLFSGGGLGFTIGSKELMQQMDGAGTTQSQNRSLVGSIGGNLNIKTGDTLTLQGSDVTAGGNLYLDTRKQNLDVAVDTWHSVQKTESKSSGLTVQLTSPLISGVQAMASATETALKSKDDRVKALSTATAALAGYNSYTAYQQALAGQNTKEGNGIKLSISIGGSRSESTTVSDSHNESGSLLKSGSTLVDLAHGAGQGSIVTGKGAQFVAGKDLTLQAEGDIHLLAAKSTSSEHTTSSSSSAAVGVAIGYGSEGFTYGFSGSASYGRGKVDGNGSQYQLSELNAGGKLNLVSGGNVTLQGIAKGQQVVGDIAGNLKIDSLQDTSTYHSLNQSISAQGSMSGGSATLSQQKMDADYASVQRQSGIQAGDGGFQLKVKGATTLNGAEIASTDKAAQDGKNSLQTGALVLKDIDNHADFTASSVSVTAGSGGVSGMAMAASDHDNSTTRAGISAGSLIITDNALQQAQTGQTAAQAASTANRDVSSDRDGSGKLANNFNASEVQGLFDAANALNQQVGTFMANKAAEAKMAADALKDADPNSPDYASKKQAADDTAKWAPGGSYSQILTAVTAGIGGNLANGLTGMAQNAGIAYLQGLGAQEVKALADDLERAQSNDPDHADKKPEGEVVRAVLHAALACAGAEASGQSCGAGAAGGAASVALNNALDKLQHTDADKMTAEQKLQRENLVNGLLTGLSTATGGASTAATTVNAAKTEMENNTLSLSEKKRLQAANAACSVTNRKACDEAAKLKALDAKRNKEVENKLEKEDQSQGVKLAQKRLNDQGQQLSALQQDAVLLQKQLDACQSVVVRCGDTSQLQSQLAATKQLIGETQKEIRALSSAASSGLLYHNIAFGGEGLGNVGDAGELFGGYLMKGVVKGSLGLLKESLVADIEVGLGGKVIWVDEPALLAGNIGLQDGSIGLARNGRRLVLDQRYVSGIGDYACGPTSCAMVLNDAGKWANIKSLANTAGIEAPFGTNVVGLTKALRANGMESASWSLNATVDDLASQTARGHAAIARMELDRGGHFVVVDGVTTRQGQAVVAVRDPGNGTQYFVPKTEFESKFSGQVVFTGKKP
ncbi:hemagglutinin repeat-containing protein [Chromobacterium violaceum]|uniref:two-partner secretion domain-containing protein n=1 Tax=Chromobacterium violaceum TaxID=536 RepID=UPI00195037C9|nr:hemagglutinin repeat-containing protein [Chromobacterium violaceum]QRO33536.1 hemagglutinin repeat-containing protein [Chromobacterium violaceum]QRQ16660.1 hemagglutinin repeat-containing protein [Chromobacterium violaceum]